MNDHQAIRTYIQQHPGCTSRQIRDALGLTPGQCQGRLASMQSNGLVTRPNLLSGRSSMPPYTWYVV